MAEANQENDKSRKSDAQKMFEQADNAGRFSGEDADSKAAREQAMENIRQEKAAKGEEKDLDNGQGQTI